MNDYVPQPVAGLPSSIDGLYGVVLNLMMGVGIAVTLIGIILSGIQFITSRGDAKAVDKAKSSLTYSVLGVVLVIGAFSVKILIINSLGIDSPEISNPVPGF